MMSLVIAIHVIACLLLMTIVLIQQGRGTGLVEQFSGVESMFGPKTSVFLTRATTVLSITFFLTCLSLAVLSARQSRSLMQDIKLPPVKASDTTPAQTASQPQTPVTETTAAVSQPAQAASEGVSGSQQGAANKPK